MGRHPGTRPGEYASSVARPDGHADLTPTVAVLPSVAIRSVRRSGRRRHADFSDAKPAGAAALLATGPYDPGRKTLLSRPADDAPSSRTMTSCTGHHPALGSGRVAPAGTAFRGNAVPARPRARF
ncbi:hypothetical protein PSD17_14170 [Pseudonocardia sp. D17]|nr:hypothetical protein PSD17_14170 [Pseudonocardia sp. D17]